MERDEFPFIIQIDHEHACRIIILPDPVYGPKGDWSRDTAKMILRAVNNHDPLLEALKEAGEDIHSEYCGKSCHPKCLAVTDAIAAAEGEQHAFT